MYDVEKLVSIVCDYLDAEADYMKYSLDARKELGLAPDSTLWIPSLNGSKAYGFQEYVCTARFSNGEAWYQLASNPRARLKSVVA